MNQEELVNIIQKKIENARRDLEHTTNIKNSQKYAAMKIKLDKECERLKGEIEAYFDVLNIMLGGLVNVEL